MSRVTPSPPASVTWFTDPPYNNPAGKQYDHPASDRTMANTLATWWMQVGYDTGFIVVREFWPDVRRKFGKHTK
jgi:hypothetical protein